MSITLADRVPKGKIISRFHSAQILGWVLAALLFIVVLLGAIFMLMPFVWMVVTAQKELHEISRVPITWLPDNPLNWNNYHILFTRYPTVRWLLNSIFVSTVSILTSIFFCLLAGYAFAKLRFRGREICFAIVLAVLMIPFEVTFLPLFVMLSRVGLVNTYLGVIFPNFMSAIGVFIMRQFIQGIPNDYLDAARIDGASEAQIIWQLIAPLTMPAIVTIAVLKFIITWNMFLWPLVMVNDREMMTMPLGISTLVDQFIIDYGLLAAGSTLMVLPPLILFLFAQRWVINGMVLTGLKG